jgi:hypothetical protein
MEYLILDSIRIVNSGKLWQDSETWNSFEVYNHATNELITQGHDIIEIRANKTFLIECKPNVEGLVYYGAKFKLSRLNSNILEVEVLCKNQ